MTDALERLKNRTRPTVRSRDTSLASTSPDISTPRLLESEAPGVYSTSLPTSSDISASRHLDSKVPTSPEVSGISPLDASSSRTLDSQSPREAELNQSRSLDVKNSVSADISTSLIAEAATLGNLGAETGLKTKQSTLRLEQGVGDRLQDLCREQGICREVLIEALFEFGETHPDLLAVVLAQAKAKNSQRQQMANQRRAQSMMQRFGQA
jgi:hypothetical protein